MAITDKMDVVKAILEITIRCPHCHRPLTIFRLFGRDTSWEYFTIQCKHCDSLFSVGLNIDHHITHN